MMQKLIILCLILFSLTAYGQTDKEKAYNLGVKAIQEMDGGNIKLALKYLNESIELDPNNIHYPYEIAYAHYLDKNYKESIKVLKGLKKHKDVYDRIYQMLGNCYDMDKNPSKAIKTYDAGLKLFPSSGILYLERGNMELQNKDYEKALDYYEKGIAVQPDFASNYYWATKIYLSSTEEIWGMIYGEIFMNLERNSSRTAELSKILFETYQREIKFTSDTSFSVSFSQNGSLNIGDLSDPTKFKPPYGLGVYEPTLMMCLINEESITLTSLDRIRTTFLKYYYESGYDTTYPNVLFEYQKKIEAEGHLMAYNHWLLMKGDEEGFAKWAESNPDKWESFVAWFSENPIEISKKNKFHSGQY